MKPFKHIILGVASAIAMAGCTDLTESPRSSITTSNYYNTADDVYRIAYRAFEHGFWTVAHRFTIQELTADQIITPKRGTWYDNVGTYRQLHQHQYGPDIDFSAKVNYCWSGCFQGIGECNYVIDELNSLNPDNFGIPAVEFDNLKAQNRAMRAWFYLQALDVFRNVPMVVSFYDQSQNTLSQVPPKQTFEFIEKELIACLGLIEKKESLGSQARIEGRWTSASVAALLVRLYLNAEVYIGEDRFADCAKYARAIIDGEYGPYEIADRWDAIFDWDNDTCDEMIFGFPATLGYTHWHFGGPSGEGSEDTYWNTVPYNSNLYFGDIKSRRGIHSCKFSAAPSYDLYGNLYTHKLGMPIEKFRRYPSDYRLKLYRNLGNSTREGMFIYGSLEYTENGETKYLTAPEQGYKLYIRDAVGQFNGLTPDSWPSDKRSNIENGDFNSGWHFAKYPLYGDNDPHQLESDFVEIRLPEVIYSLAECELRAGHTETAAKLLNDVRRRNYPAEDWPDVLYAPEGKAKLDMDEMLDEWGREFFAECRRRIDLIRFGKFSSGVWWDKTADPDNHYEIMPIPVDVINLNHQLVQNPHY